MHTRRMAAFLAGAWLLGGLLMSLLVVPSVSKQVDIILAAPPKEIAKDIDDLGTDVTRLMLRYQAEEVRRFVFEVWGIVQLGLAAALIGSVSFTPHRSKFLVIASVLLAVFVSIQTLLILPTLKATGRSIDFVPLLGNAPAREVYHTYQIWYRVLEVLKLIGGLAISGRLLFDLYAWTHPVSTSDAPPRRRRKRTHDGSVAEEKAQAKVAQPES